MRVMVSTMVLILVQRIMVTFCIKQQAFGVFRQAANLNQDFAQKTQELLRTTSC